MLPPRRPAVAALLVSLVVSVIVMVPATAQEPAEQSQLAEARRRIASVTAQLGEAKAEAADAAAAVAAADQRLREVEEAVNLAAAAVAQQQLAVEEAARRLADTEAASERVRYGLETRAIDLFKHGASRPIDALFAGGDISESLERSEFVRILTLSDSGQLEGLRAALTRVAADRERLEAEQASLLALEAEQRELLAQVRAIREHAAMQAAQARSRAAGLADQKEDLERDAKRIEALIRSRATPRRTTGSPSTAGYIWPRCDRVTSEYGWRWGRRHAGIDIDGDGGEPIYAAKAGTVIHADWQGGYGRLVLVDHGDGVVTAYAHMSAFSVGGGQRVERGQRLGSVGSTGNSTGSHLHFETRVDGQAVNPRRFLPSGC